MNRNRASRPSEALPVWDLPLRLFHWSLAGTTVLAFVSANPAGALAGWHTAAGWSAAVLIVFRLVWGLIGGHHARFASFVRPGLVAGHLRDILRGRARRWAGHDPAGGMAVIAMLVCLGAVVVSGHRADAGQGGGLHPLLAWLLVALILGHIAAVIGMSVLNRENLTAAMITGRKNARKHPAIRRRVRPSPAAFVLALAIAGGAVQEIRRLDPDAFAPHRPGKPAAIAAQGLPDPKLAAAGGGAGGAVGAKFD